MSPENMGVKKNDRSGNISNEEKDELLQDNTKSEIENKLNFEKNDNVLSNDNDNTLLKKKENVYEKIPSIYDEVKNIHDIDHIYIRGHKSSCSDTEYINYLSYEIYERERINSLCSMNHEFDLINDSIKINEALLNNFKWRCNFNNDNSNGVEKENSNILNNINNSEINENRSTIYNNNEKGQKSMLFNEKLKHLYKEYLSYSIPESPRNGKGVVNSLNNFQSKLFDIEISNNTWVNIESDRIHSNCSDYKSTIYNSNSLNNSTMSIISDETINNSSNLIGNNIIYGYLNNNIKLEYHKYKKFNDILYYSHILYICESIYDICIKYQKASIHHKRIKQKYANLIFCKNLSHKNSKDIIQLVREYEKIVRKNSFNKDAYINAKNNKTEFNKNFKYDYYYDNNDSDAENCNGMFFNFLLQRVEKIKNINKYKEFCDHLEKVIGDKNYTFKEYCDIFSNLIITNIINVVPFSKFHLFIKIIVNYFWRSSKHQESGYKNTIDLIKFCNAQHNNEMKASNTIQKDKDSHKPLHGSIVQLNYLDPIENNNCVSNSSIPSNNPDNNLESNMSMTSKINLEDTSTLNNAQNEKKVLSFETDMLDDKDINVIKKFAALPKYRKTYANSRFKLNQTISIYDLLRDKNCKEKPYAHNSGMRKK
ncbi:conserved Plasmodium protein, unknown function [Plasmodium vinckei vinckei]|uniref:Uncharacterized protein n=1 Tax=Plasmodium vinckei vinckei TaxID=54757 RepID=A0A449BZN6_PLAVN|nr:conserved Plasmodium protein, unknown function [Plasmodium vinckei vinckei]KEG04249.1 hypothetical protein YYE_01155 [Plasmodium vinckei vinckei]VEV58950.1 conserved Plasmodium protein, unknown function [Plasmodium vinckei vinckei]